jgi:alkylation response protein AidB-like acyl-CoA dehydrogenase
MDFSLTPEQRMFQEAIARFAQEKLETYVKRMEETDDCRSPAASCRKALSRR